MEKTYNNYHRSGDNVVCCIVYGVSVDAALNSELNSEHYAVLTA